MNTILQLTLCVFVFILSILFTFRFSNPSSPITSDGFVHAPATLNLLEPKEKKTEELIESFDHKVHNRKKTQPPKNICNRTEILSSDHEEDQ